MWWGWATSRFEEMISDRNRNSRSESGCRMGRKAACHERSSQDVCSCTLNHRQNDSKLWTQKSFNSNLRKSWLLNVLCRSLHFRRSNIMSSVSWVPIEPKPVTSLIISRCMPWNNILYLLICISSGQTWSHLSNCSLMLLYYGHCMSMYAMASCIS